MLNGGWHIVGVWMFSVSMRIATVRLEVAMLMIEDAEQWYQSRNKDHVWLRSIRPSKYSRTNRSNRFRSSLMSTSLNIWKSTWTITAAIIKNGGNRSGQFWEKRGGYRVLVEVSVATLIYNDIKGLSVGLDTDGEELDEELRDLLETGGCQCWSELEKKKNQARHQIVLNIHLKSITN